MYIITTNLRSEILGHLHNKNSTLNINYKLYTINTYLHNIHYII